MKKIFYYCQHVLGIGHYFRTLEICKALKNHDVILLNGGPPIDVIKPSGIREINLPGIIMDEDFNELQPVDPRKRLEDVKKERKEILINLFKNEKPDLFIIELYPFGRKAFQFELDIILSGIRTGQLPGCPVICSLRDILVEKKDPDSYERRVVNILNNNFDALLVHSDPSLISLEETFDSIAKIDIPIIYTGFIAPEPDPESGKRLRRNLRINDKEFLLVASAGGGKVGFNLLENTVRALALLETERPLHSFIFTGPFMDEEKFSLLKSLAGIRTNVRRFTDDFLSYMKAADLSVSMAGYNTCMNILASRVSAIVYPFSQNREQLIRSEKLAQLGVLEILNDDLNPSDLADSIKIRISNRNRQRTPVNVDLKGAQNTASWVVSMFNAEVLR